MVIVGLAVLTFYLNPFCYFCCDNILCHKPQATPASPSCRFPSCNSHYTLFLSPSDVHDIILCYFKALNLMTTVQVQRERILGAGINGKERYHMDV